MAIPIQAILAAVLIHILWGGNPVAVKFGLEAFPPFWSAFLRFAVALICVAGWARVRGIRLRPNRGELRVLFLLSTIFLVQIWSMNLGFSLSSGAVSAVLISTHPLFAALFAHFMISGDTLSPGRAFGLLVALGGTALIVLRGGGMSGAEFSLAGATIVLGSSLMLGWRLIFAARQTRKFEPTRVVFWMMGLSIIPFAAGGALFEEIAWSKLGWEPVAGILYQGIVIAGLGFMVNAELMKRYSPAAMSSFAFIAPISGVLLSVWLLDEHFTWIIAIGTVCVGAGLVLIARPRKKAN